jgi:hypothetical protein
LNELFYRGFLPSAFEGIKGTRSKNSDDFYQAVRDAKFEILARGGEGDRVIPISNKEVLSSWNSRINNIVIKNGSHSLPFTQAREIIDATNISG